jgi:serine/threonine protein kinase
LTEVETTQAQKRTCLLCQKEYAGDITTCPDDGTALAQLTGDELIGKMFAERYEIIEPIGGGGMGKVYKAKHLLMNRIVAIKVLRKDVIATAETLKRFRVEAQATSALSLPNILAVYDFGISAEGQAYMVMDYLDGRGLNDILERERKLSIERALAIFIQICQGLAHAHSKGIIHRDIKPGNIMIVNWEGQSDFVKIVDFGIAKLLNEDSDSVNLTRTGEVFGSPLYMSPEQWKGHKLDHRTDIFSLGCIMYRALSGQTVFQTENAFDAMYKQVHEVPVPLCTLCPEIPADLGQVVMKAIAKDPDSRYQSMSDLRIALEQVRDAIDPNLSGAQNTVISPSAAAPDAVSALRVVSAPDVVSDAVSPLNRSGSLKTLGSLNAAAAIAASETGPMVVTVSMPGDRIENTMVPPGANKDETVHLVLPKKSLTWVAISAAVLSIAVAVFAWSAFHAGQSAKTSMPAPPPAPPLPGGINGLNPNTVDAVPIPGIPGTNAIPGMQPSTGTQLAPPVRPAAANNYGTAQERTLSPASEQAAREYKHERSERQHAVTHEKKRGFVGKLKRLIDKL